MKDFAGNELEIGMRVIYLTAGTSSSWMSKGEIVDFTPQKVRIVDDGRLADWKRTQDKYWTTLRFPVDIVLPMTPEIQDYLGADWLRANLTN